METVLVLINDNDGPQIQIVFNVTYNCNLAGWKDILGVETALVLHITYT